jgi:hypothetical protein
MMEDNIVFLGKQLAKEPQLISNSNLKAIVLPKIDMNQQQHNLNEVIKRGKKKKIKLV